MTVFMSQEHGTGRSCNLDSVEFIFCILTEYWLML